ncbi:hypothetical protein SCHPADRAFT_910106 [Schizopora paradoxa]|uniref:Uncharacterized protein n=1 Tax=Schizopora paradoxa TaxID=27342 RepID=A0A0H2R4H1_9AGAM|nr:hypothetical protein SCHPADRAFT_910106 [Schizopora paradoxa]
MPETATMSAIAALARPQPETERQQLSSGSSRPSASSSPSSSRTRSSSSNTFTSSSSASGSSKSNTKSKKPSRPMPLRTKSILRAPLRDGSGFSQPLQIPIPPTLQDSPLLQSPHSIFRRSYSGAHTPDEEEERWLRDTVPINSPSNYSDGVSGGAGSLGRESAMFGMSGSVGSSSSRSLFPQSPPVQTPVSHHHHHERRGSISQVQQSQSFAFSHSASSSSLVGLGFEDPRSSYNSAASGLPASPSSASFSRSQQPPHPSITQQNPSISSSATFPGSSRTSSSASSSYHAPSHSSRSATPQQGLGTAS